jgi:hypothetical protein
MEGKTIFLFPKPWLLLDLLEVTMITSVRVQLMKHETARGEEEVLP